MNYINFKNSKDLFNYKTAWFVSISSIQFFTIVFFVFLLLSMLVGSRDLSVGTDTKTYVQIYESILNSSPLIEFEPGFQALSSIAAAMTLTTFGYLFLLSFTQFLLLIFISTRLAFMLDYGNKKQAYSFLLLSCFIVSPFFLSAQINAIRQGISALILIYAAISFLEKKTVQYLVWAAIAIIFHYSAIIYGLLIVLLMFGHKRILFITITLFFLYILGATETLVEIFSNISGLPIHTYIIEYVALNGYRSGIRLDFAAFSLILPLFCLGLVKILLPSNFRRFAAVMNIYFIFMIPFWIFGWGDYSNRYAFNAWLFMPIFLSSMLYPFIRKLSTGVTSIIFIFSALIFLLNLSRVI